LPSWKRVIISGSDAALNDLNLDGNLVVLGGATGSFTGSFTGDGTNLTGVTAEWDGSHFGDASITGSLAISGSGIDLTVMGGNVGVGTTSPTAGLQLLKNGAASVSHLLSEGTWFSGGTATTTKPAFLLEPAGTTSTAWSTSGTGLGINAPSGATGNLIDAQVNGVSKFYIDKDGISYFKSPNGLRTGRLYADNTNTILASGVVTFNLSHTSNKATISNGDLWVYRGFHVVQNSSLVQAIDITYNTSITGTSGNFISLNSIGTFAPTSGTATFVSLTTTSTINQTGGASGITRGLYINPTITAAADWRSIETSNNTGFSFYGAGTANSYFGGNVGIGTTSPTAKLEVKGDILINKANISNQENLDADIGIEVVAQVAIATYTAAFFDYVIKKGTNVRAGIVYACHDGTNVEFTETSTTDLGSTTDLVLGVDISAGNMRLLASAASDNWIVKSLVRAL